MSRRPTIPQSRRHIMVYDEDWALLRELFDGDSSTSIGVGTACKEILHRKCQELRARFVAKLDSIPKAEQPGALASIIKLEAGPQA